MIEQQKWISVKEQLPNEDEIIYNSIGIAGEINMSDRVLAIDSTGFIRCGYFMKSCSKHTYYGNGKRNKYSDYGKASWAFGEHYNSNPRQWVVGIDVDIVAWMPLPEPYKEVNDAEIH